MGRSAALVLLLCAGVATPASPAPPQVVTTTVHLGDGTVRALCTSGPRRVVLLHDSGSSAETWRPVLERLEGAVGACAYDRPGSPDDGPSARGWFELVDEMRRVHSALGFPRGYTLVGHAVGGLYARLYAAERPADVGGLVLVDPAHEDMLEEAGPGMPHAAREEWARRSRHPNADGIRESELGARARQLRLPDIPVTVITATRRRHEPGWDDRFLNEAARRVHASVLRGITLGRHVPAERSGHDVQLDEPELVASEILRVVRLSQAAGLR